MSYCVACGHHLTIIHHVKTKGAYPAMREAHFNLMPLCVHCHHKAHKMGLNRFYDSNKAVSNWLTKKGWERDTFSGKWLPPEIGLEL